MNDLVFLFDVDNTLLDNDCIVTDLSVHLALRNGAHARDCYFEQFEELRKEMGYANYLGALQRYRLKYLHEPRVLSMSNWLIDYPFAKRLYPGALDALAHAESLGPAVILSDGDAVFQPRKVERSGLAAAVDDRVMIFIHKEEELDYVAEAYPAKHYVLIDDKLRILDAVKRQWGARVTTVFVKQGHYASDPEILAKYPKADVEIDTIKAFIGLCAEIAARLRDAAE